MNCLSKAPFRQCGATLIVTMIFLVLLTFLGVSTIQDTTLEEKMASNLHQSNLVFQAAEEQLRIAEESLDNDVLSFDFGTDEGYYRDGETGEVEAVINKAASLADCAKGSLPSDGWASCGAKGALLAGYVIQERDAVTASQNESLEAGAVKDDVDRVFEITARAESSVTSAVTILRTIYRR